MCACGCARCVLLGKNQPCGTFVLSDLDALTFEEVLRSGGSWSRAYTQGSPPPLRRERLRATEGIRRSKSSNLVEQQEKRLTPPSREVFSHSSSVLSVRVLLCSGRDPVVSFLLPILYRWVKMQNDDSTPPHGEDPIPVQTLKVTRSTGHAPVDTSRTNPCVEPAARREQEGGSRSGPPPGGMPGAGDGPGP